MGGKVSQQIRVIGVFNYVLGSFIMLLGVSLLVGGIVFQFQRISLAAEWSASIQSLAIRELSGLSFVLTEFLTFLASLVFFLSFVFIVLGLFVIFMGKGLKGGESWAISLGLFFSLGIVLWSFVELVSGNLEGIFGWIASSFLLVTLLINILIAVFLLRK